MLDGRRKPVRRVDGWCARYGPALKVTFVPSAGTTCTKVRPRTSGISLPAESKKRVKLPTSALRQVPLKTSTLAEDPGLSLADLSDDGPMVARLGMRIDRERHPEDDHVPCRETGFPSTASTCWRWA